MHGRGRVFPRGQNGDDTRCILTCARLLKTLLTLVALTAVLTMGGGLYNVLRYEGAKRRRRTGFAHADPHHGGAGHAGGGHLATTMVYGRLAADNEFTACRAAESTLHAILGALLVSVFVAVFTLLFGDLVVPDVTRRLNQYVRANLRDLALQRMETKGYVRYQRGGSTYLLTAENMRVPSERALQEQNLPTGEGFSYLLMDSPFFVMLDKDERLQRYACAKHGLCQFDAQSPLQVTLFVNGGRDFDVHASSAYLESRNRSISVPLEFPRRPGMLGSGHAHAATGLEIEQLQPKIRSFQLNLGAVAVLPTTALPCWSRVSRLSWTNARRGLPYLCRQGRGGRQRLAAVRRARRTTGGGWGGAAVLPGAPGAFARPDGRQRRAVPAIGRPPRYGPSGPR